MGDLHRPAAQHAHEQDLPALAATANGDGRAFADERAIAPIKKIALIDPSPISRLWQVVN
jgi:hypothetical protein